MMMRKRYMLCLPLVAAMVALMAASAFAVAPTIDELPRVVVGPGNTFNNAVNLDAYIDWFPVNGANLAGANWGYVGHGSPAYGSGSRFHVYLYDTGASARTLSNEATLAQSVDLLTGTPAALPAQSADRYGVEPYPSTTNPSVGPKMLDLVFSAANTTTTAVDVFAVVEGGVTGNQLVAGWKGMTVATGPDTQGASYGIDFVAGRDTDSFALWIPALWTGASYTALPPTGTNLSNVSWNGKPMRDKTRLAAWTITGFEPDGIAHPFAVGAFTAVGIGAGGTGYVSFIPSNGGGVASPVFQAKARFVSSASTALASPGYRVGFLNSAQTHFGQLQVIGDTLSVPYGSSGTATSLRDSGHDFVARCYWATPSTLTEMGDTGAIGNNVSVKNVVYDAGSPNVVLCADGRDYGVQILCIAQSSSTNQFVIDTLSVTTLSDASLVPAASPAPAEWTGTTGLSAAGWFVSYFGGVYTDGLGTLENGALLLWGARDARHNPSANISTQGTFRVVKASPASGYIAAASLKLYRSTLAVQSGGIIGDGDTKVSPSLAFHTTVQSYTGGVLGDSAHASAIGWLEVWGPSPIVKPLATHPAGAGGPGVPTATGSTLRSYMWTHTVPGGTYVVVPEIIVYNDGTYNPFPTQWGDADGYLKFTDIKIEQITNDLR
jgi:hypothetical protein